MANGHDTTRTTYVSGWDGGQISNPILAPHGTAMAPAYTFADDLDTGIARPGNDTLYLCAGGSYKISIDTGYIDFNPNLIAITCRTRLYNNNDALNLGDSASTGHGLGIGDIICGDKLEVDGDCYLDGAVLQLDNIPIADPLVAGRVWSNGGVLTVSAG